MKTDNDGEREHSFFTTLVIARTDLRGVTRNFHWFMGLQTSYPPLIGLHTSVSSQDFLLYFFHGETPARKQGFIFMDVKRRGVPLSSTGLNLNMDTMPCPTTQSSEKRWGPAQHSTAQFTCGSSTDACSAVLDCFEQPKQRVCTHGGREKRTAVAAVEN